MEKKNNEVEEMKNGDLSPSTIARFVEPKKTWFIERTGDKKIFACEEVEAWKLLTNRSNWVRHDFRIIGVSDGKTFDKIVREGQSKSRVVLQEIKAIEAEANKYRTTEEKFVFEDLLDVNDPKVKKVRAIIAEYDKKLEKKNSEYNSFTRDIAKTAFDAELKVAKRKPKVFPGNQDIITPDATGRAREKIISKMG